jgi:chorismate mutase
VNDLSYEDEIRLLRNEINRINFQIVEKIGERVDVALRIAEVKRRSGRPIRDTNREEAVLDNVSRLGSERGLDPLSVRKVFREIIELCVRAEESVS